MNFVNKKDPIKLQIDFISLFLNKYFTELKMNKILQNKNKMSDLNSDLF